jgi:hypothetical protein
VLLAALAVALVTPDRASALCAGPGPWRSAIADAPAVFVGEVVSVRSAGRWATVAVEAVWKGDVEDVVEVRSGAFDAPGGLVSESSVDRSYDEGGTYVFVPFGGGGDVFEDNSCTRTTPYRTALEAHRPGPARTPEPASPTPAVAGGEEDNGASWPVPFLVGVLAGGVAVAGLVVVLRARPRPGGDRRAPAE